MSSYVYYAGGNIQISSPGNFVYEGSGRLCASSWVCYQVQKFYQTKFKERDVVYVRKKACRGILEAVAIKQVDFVNNLSTGGQFVPLYIDTYNSYWNEDMIVNQQDAIYLAKEYYILQIASVQQAMQEENPKLV